MRLLRKSIVPTEVPVEVYDLEVDSDHPNFCLGNGAVVHNSKDIADAVCGATYSLYKDIDFAGQLSNRYKLNTHAELLKERTATSTSTFQDILGGLGG